MTIPIEEFAWRVIELFPQMHKGLLRQERNYLTRGEITLPQFWVLAHLYHTGESTMNSLAKHLRISPPATTGLIDRLIAQKLVARRHDARDRRIVRIELTGKGTGVIGDIRKQKIRTLIKVFNRISSKDRDQYLKILERIVKVINSLPSGRGRDQEEGKDSGRGRPR